MVADQFFLEPIDNVATETGKCVVVAIFKNKKEMLRIQSSYWGNAIYAFVSSSGPGMVAFLNACLCSREQHRK